MHLSPIAFVHSPYKQKFAIPRQPNLVPQARGEIIFEPEFADPNCLRGIEEFSHLWLIFLFHETAHDGWNPVVHPPRLGGHETRGVFSTRSTHRPNPVGMSVVKRGEWSQKGAALSLSVEGIDLLDGTPIIDIKPYLPWADALPHANAGFADEAPAAIEVAFTDQAQAQIADLSPLYKDLKAFISAVLAQDPRPSYRKKPGDTKQYGISLYDLNIKWHPNGHGLLVTSVKTWRQTEAES